MNIFVGNLARDVTEEDIRAQFEPFGQVASVSIIKDKFNGQPKGIAYVEMPEAEQGQAAVTGLKGKRLKERTMDIDEVRPFKGGGKRFGGKRKPHRR